MRARLPVNTEIAEKLNTALNGRIAAVAGTPAEMALRSQVRHATLAVNHAHVTRTRKPSGNTGVKLDMQKDQISNRMWMELTSAAHDLRMCELPGAEELWELQALLADADKARYQKGIIVTLDEYRTLEAAATAVVTKARTRIREATGEDIDLTRYATA